MKKKISVFLTIVLCLFALIGCAPKDKTTGMASQTFYATAQQTVKAFLDEQISGDRADAELVEYKAGAKLSQKEIKKLNLTSEVRKQLNSAEKGTVTYFDSVDEQQKSKDIYLLDCEDGFRYYVNYAVKGEEITSADIYNISRKFSNCTIKQSISDGDLSGFELTMKADDKYIEIDMLGTKQYWVVTPNGLRYFLDMSTIGVDSTLLGRYFEGTSSMDEYADIFYEKFDESSNCVGLIMYLVGFNYDHTYFMRTAKGFEITGDDFIEVCKQTAKDAVAELDGLGYDVSYDYSTDGYYRYHVEHGYLNKVEFKVNATVTSEVFTDYYGSSTIDASASGKYEFSKYGKTKVNLPSEIKEMLAK